jgi:hypothetical protein
MHSPLRSLTTIAAASLLLVTAACVDLEVRNLNAPDGARALTAEITEALIAGAYADWLDVHNYVGPTLILSAVAGEHSSPWCFQSSYSRIPRRPTTNAAGDPYVRYLTYAWYQAYDAIAALRQALRRIEDGLDLGPGRTLRTKAFGKFVQGLAHGSVALLYDSGFVYDETVSPTAVRLQSAHTVMDAALAYLDEAVALAEGMALTIPTSWMSREVSAETLVRLAHSWKARFRASVARTDGQRRIVDWAAVVTDVNAGITEDWSLVSQCWARTFCDEALLYRMYPSWHMQDNWIAGMADQSGAYQEWIETPLYDKRPFLIVTPDTRWPRGADEATQLANPGEYFAVNSGSSRIWSRPDRGTWRWSYYDQTYEPFHSFALTGEGKLPQITVREMRALAAEAAYYRGDMEAVASFVNETRTRHGLQPTDATGANPDCVPRLPDGSCGDLWEMFKWEKRLETQFAGPLRAGWYFDGRGWGDLMEGTFLQFPVPYGEMEILERAPYDYGGVGGLWGAPVGTYGY